MDTALEQCALCLDVFCSVCSVVDYEVRACAPMLCAVLCCGLVPR